MSVWLSNEKEQLFHNNLKKIYSGENFIDNNKCKKIVGLIHEYYLENPLIEHRLSSLYRDEICVSKLSLNNIYTPKQLSSLSERLEEYLDGLKLKSGSFISSSAVGFSALAILIGFGSQMIIKSSNVFPILLIFLLSLNIFDYAYKYFKYVKSIDKTSTIISLIKHLK